MSSEGTQSQATNPSVPLHSDGGTREQRLERKPASLEELVYTSAPRLLDSSASHLGVVARSKGFPGEVETAVSKQWAYSMPSSLGLPETQTLPRFHLLPVGPDQRWTTLSRVQSAGFDHTGRTTPIAQHFAADREQLESCGESVASIARWASRHYVSDRGRVFWDRWEGDPRELESRPLPSGQSIAPTAMLGDIPADCGPCTEDIRRAWCLGVETLLAYPGSQRMAVFVIRPSFAPYVLSFLGAILESLPKRIQSQVTATSHVWEVSDAPANYWITFTYPRSPYLERVKERADSKKPVLVDMALKTPVIPAADGAYVTRLLADCPRWSDLHTTVMPRLFDAVDPQIECFARVIEVKDALDTWTSDLGYFKYAELLDAAGRAKQGGLPPKGIDALLGRIGVTTASMLEGSREWNTLHEVSLDDAVPRAVRQHARDRIGANFARIATEEPALVAGWMLRPGSEPIAAFLSEHSGVMDAVLSEVESRSKRLPPEDLESLVGRWASIGTPTLVRFSKRVSEELAQGRLPSTFHRQVLDILIPHAVIPSQDGTSVEKGVDSPAASSRLETLLQPAWAIMSRQIAASEFPDALCMMVFDRLAPMAVVAEKWPSRSGPSSATPAGGASVGRSRADAG